MKFQTSIQSLVFSPLKFRIASFLVKDEVFRSEREIGRLIGVSHVSVNLTMKEFQELNFVRQSRVGSAHVWKVNRRSYAYQIFSRIAAEMKALVSPLEALKSIILEHLPRALVKEIVLFGSVARGEERADSDIDLFILADHEGVRNEIVAAAENLSLLLIDKFGNPLSPYVLTAEQVKEKAHLKLLSEIKSGITIFKRDAELDIEN
jgi:predicted nucleotidyltransferase